MKIVVIGLGSMGKRRIRLLQKHFGEHKAAGVDENPQRCSSAAEEYGIPVYRSLKEAVQAENAECAFICTSPLSHHTIIRECLNLGLHVFTEINLVSDGYTENQRLAEKKQATLFLSSSMIYRDELQYLKEEVRSCPRKCCYNYHVGQYLQDWHPWENYRDFFAGQKRTNGCREILAIELPWISHVFGEIVRIQAQKTKVTDLAIDFNDCYMLLLEHSNGNQGVFMVDVVSREPVRSLRVINEELYIEWQGEPESLRKKNPENGSLEQILLYQNIEHTEGYNKTIVENEYQNEMQQFFDELEKGKEAVYGFEEDEKILSLIDRIEE